MALAIEHRQAITKGRAVQMRTTAGKAAATIADRPALTTGDRAALTTAVGPEHAMPATIVGPVAPTIISRPEAGKLP